MSEPRHYAGVLVTAEPGALDAVAAALAALDGVGVHQRDAATGRCVAVLESADRAGQERLFRAVEALPGVRGADLVYHLVDPETVSRLVLEEPAR
jgi:nitrate reductase NapAB chaperone NapD